MAIMGFLAVANAYTMRVCLNIAITQMVHRPSHSTGNDGSCPASDVQEAIDGAGPTVSTYYSYRRKHRFCLPNVK